MRRRIAAFALLAVSTLTTSAAFAADAKVTRYVRFEKDDGTAAYGVVEGDRVRELSGDLFGKHEPTGKDRPLKGLKILVPTVPSKVIALAGNYRDHLGDRPAPKFPEPFFKVPSCLQRHDGPVVQPKDAEPVHYEAELVIVIGKRARNVPEERALEYVLGITCGNDISARKWQDNDVQWWRAKGSDTFGPCGPFIASGIDYDALAMELRVNGEVRQKTNTKNMIHNVPQTVAYISRWVTLEPGDLIFAGTPGKTQGMKPGDVVEVEIEGVGVLRNRVVMEK